MSWALHYAITLERALSPDEAQALERLCERRSLWLERVVAGPGRMPEWKGLIPDEEYQRLEALQRGAPAPEGRSDFSGFIQLGSTRQLCRVVAWLQEVEKLLPVRAFVVSEDYSITQKCRPSEVDLEGLKRKAQAEQQAERESENREEADDPEDLRVDALVDEGHVARAQKLEEVLAQARKDFALWKNAQRK